MRDSASRYSRELLGPIAKNSPSFKWKILSSISPTHNQTLPKPDLRIVLTGENRRYRVDDWNAPRGQVEKLQLNYIAAYKAGARFEYTLGPRKGRRQTHSSDELAAKRSARKLAERDVTGAVQALLSQDGFAARSADSLRQMRERHPEEPADIAYPPHPSEPWPSQTSPDLS